MYREKMRMLLCFVLGAISLVLSSTIVRADPLDRVLDAFFSTPPDTIDICFRRHMSYSMPSQERILEDAEKRLTDMQLERAIRGASTRPVEVDRAQIAQDITRGHEQLKDRSVDQRWVIGNNSDFRAETLTFQTKDDIGGGQTDPTTLYVQPSRDSVTTLTPKVAEYDRKLLRQGIRAAAALEDFRRCGRSSHPMMSALTAMMNGKFAPQPGQKMVSPAEAQKVLESLKKAMRNQFVVQSETLNGKEVFRVATRDDSSVFWADQTDPRICYKRQSVVAGRVVLREEFADFRPDTNAGLLYPHSMTLFKVLSDGRTLDETTKVVSVRLNIPVSDRDLDWSPPDGWTVLDVAAQTVSRVERGELVLVSKGASVAPNGTIMFPATEAAIGVAVAAQMKVIANDVKPQATARVGQPVPPATSSSTPVPMSTGSDTVGYYLLAGLCVVLALAWLAIRKLGLGTNQKIRRAALLLVGVSLSTVAIQLAMRNRGYLWTPPAIGALYFLTLFVRESQSPKKQ